MKYEPFSITTINMLQCACVGSEGGPDGAGTYSLVGDIFIEHSCDPQILLQIWKLVGGLVWVKFQF